MFSYEFYGIFKNTFFTEHLRVTSKSIPPFSAVFSVLKIISNLGPIKINKMVNKRTVDYHPSPPQ